MQYLDFWEVGRRVFALWPIEADGSCGCGDPECPTAGKHPRASNWQHTPHWSQDQIDTMEEMGQFVTGYGVLVHGLLVVDVDERNGGADSYAKLCEKVPEVTGAGMIVKTGSGGQSKHLYFSLPEQAALVQHLNQYPGIDFKSSGYVVGPGSLHASGNRYETVVGSPGDIATAPDALIDLLRKPERHRATVNGSPVDVSNDDLADMLEHITNDSVTDYEKWIRTGMALHLVTKGDDDGYQLWVNWSSKGPKHNERDMPKKWHSFGKSANPVTLGTLTHYAEQEGWIAPVEFTADVHFDVPQSEPLIDDNVDLLRPPGFVGELAKWINSRNRHSRESLAVAAALQVVSVVAGMRYVDPLDGITPNLFVFGVAGSATGKESVLKSAQELMRSAGVSAAVHGAIKSEQEIYRNLTRHQLACYMIDELGETLGKIQNARAKGTTAYLEGVIGVLMSVYSKANSFLQITGDLKEEIQQALAKEYSQIKARQEGNEQKNGDELRLKTVEHQLSTIDSGIESPYLSIFGLTTPERFNELMDFDMAVNGFMGRSLIFREREDNPKSKPRGKVERGKVPETIANTLHQLYAPGYSEVPPRVERVGNLVEVETTSEAEALLDQAEHHFYYMAEEHKESTGMVAIPRRGYEQVAKLSMILAIPGGVRESIHVQWAMALVKRDVEEKINLAYSNSAGDKSQALASRVLSLITSDHGETLGRLKNKCRNYRGEDVQKVLEKMEASGYVRSEETAAGRGKKTIKYFSV